MTDDATMRELRTAADMQGLSQEFAELVAERDAAVADAERYRWLKANAVRKKNLGDKCIEYHCDFEHWNDIDASIDAARAALAAPEQPAAIGQDSRILHELAGAASLCWEPKPTGVFDTSKAIGFVEDALAELLASAAPAQPLTLSDEQIDAISRRMFGVGNGGNSDRDFARAVLAAAQEGKAR